MIDADQMEHYVNRIHELDNRIEALQKRGAMLVAAAKKG